MDAAVPWLTLSCDVLVLGAGGAGVAAATAAAERGADVLVASKDPVGTGDTRISTGIVATASLAPGDGPAALAADLHRSGAGLARPFLVDALAVAADDALRWLTDAGARPDRDAHGAPRRLPRPMGGHRHPRSVPSPQRGVALAHALVDRFERAGVRSAEEVAAVELLVADGRVVGALLLSLRDGVWLAVRAGAVIVATGGCTHLYHPHADTMRSNTGDGLAMAARAGATLVDLEQVQFTPFGLVRPGRCVGLPLGEAILAGPAGRLLDARGELVADGIARLDRATLAGTMAAALAAGRGTDAGGLLLDLAPNRAHPGWWDGLRRDHGHVLRAVRRALGADAARLDAPWEVAPTAHYHMGGIAADAHGWTGVPGLFVAGQALGGLHGANRLGSTSIPAVIALGVRAGHTAASAAVPGADPDVAALIDRWSRPALEPVLPRTRALQRAAWAGLGPARDHAGLVRARDAARAAQRELTPGPRRAPVRWDSAVLARVEHHHLALVAEGLAASALDRAHTLGAHRRLDHPDGPAHVDAVAARWTHAGAVVARVPVHAPVPPAPARVPVAPPSPAPQPAPAPVAPGGTVIVRVVLPGGPLTVRAPAPDGAPTALEVLEHAAATVAPDLAYRWGCRNARCGLCTVEIDGRPRLACRDRARDGAAIAPLSTLPVVRDLVPARGPVDARLRGQLPRAPAPSAAPPTPAWRALEACVTCLACLHGCPLHAAGRGNPLAFLRLERARTAPGATPEGAAEAVHVARALGIDACASCGACTCGVGIDLVRHVLTPLADADQPSIAPSA